MIVAPTYAVSRIGPYSRILGPNALDGLSRYAVNNVTNLWGMQVASLKTGEIVTATIPDHKGSDRGACRCDAICYARAEKCRARAVRPMSR